MTENELSEDQVRELFDACQPVWEKMAGDMMGKVWAGGPILKPCPFCGGEAEIVHPYHGVPGAYIFCTNCRLSINLGFCLDDEALEKLINLWNKRVSE